MLEAQTVPLATGDSHDPPASFVSARIRAMVAIGFLALSMVVSLLTISIVRDYFFIGVPPVVVGGSLLAALAGAGCVVSFLVWFSRSYGNLRALGGEGLEYSPGVAIGWWFVPVGNFWKPFRVAVEIWRASDPTTLKSDLASRAQMPTPALLAVWWMAWLTALILDNLVAAPDRIAYQGEVVTLPMVVASGFDILAAALAMAVILEIDRRQARRHASITAMSAPGRPTSSHD
jgi:hypothetical protein